MENVKVIIWGLGAMGSGMARMLLKKEGVDIVGGVARGKKIGKPLYEIIGVEPCPRSQVVVGSIEEYITEKRADIVLLCTDSFTVKAFDRIKLIVENKMNVITCAEEMAYPQAQNPELADELDRLAKENNVSILGTGINPGLIMDLLVIMMTGACAEVEHITARRVNSLSPFGEVVMKEQGIGMDPEDFNKGIEEDTVSGHVGFPESIMMVADAIGWKLEKPENPKNSKDNVVRQTMAPIITDVDRFAPHGQALAGQVAGVAMNGYGIVDGEEKIVMEHPQQIEPDQVGVQTGDYVIVKGTPNINLANTPEVDGGIGTIAMCVNMIPQVINASAGLKTMIDLPVPRAIMGDMRDRIEASAKIVK